MRRNLIFQRIIAGFIFVYLVIFLLVMGTAVFSYNGLVSSSQAVDAQWNKLTTAFKSRADLATGLAAMMQVSPSFHGTEPTAVADAHDAIARLKVDPNQAPVEQDEVDQYGGAQTRFADALSHLQGALAAQPELVASADIKSLQAQLDDTAKQIETARQNYNASAEVFNRETGRFPVALIVRTMGFIPKIIYPSSAVPRATK